MLTRKRRLTQNEHENKHPKKELTRQDVYNGLVKGNLNVVKEAIKQNFDFNRRISWVKTPLYLACELGHTEIVRELILQKVETDVVCEFNTPFYVACNNKHIGVIKELLKAEFSKEQRDIYEPLALRTACLTGDIEFVRELAKQGFDINKPNGAGETPFYIACKFGHFELAKDLLSYKNVNTWQPNIDGNTPLFIACRKLYYKVVHLLMPSAPLSEIKKNLDIHPGKSDIILRNKLEQSRREIMKMLLFGQQQPESPLSVLHRDLLQDIEKVIKEKLFL